ncbi:MAG: chemotaxis protein CheX [Candidatus Heimdallarchaeota archaeon]
MELQNILEKALLDSVNEAFTATLSLSPQLTEEERLADIDEGLICFIGFTGYIEGSFTMSLSKQSACKIVSTMLGMEIEEVTCDVTDGIGEAINLIAGGVKTKIVETVKNFEIGIPTTVSGDHLKVPKKSDSTTRIIRNFVCDDIKFAVSIDYKIHEEEVVEKKKEEKLSIDALSKLSELIEKESNSKE